MPAHAGAAAYIDGNERTFLEKYTDYIWFVVLGLSGLGSAGAWLRHYWNKDEREQYIAHRDHLLELISRVRSAETPDELAEMQGAADSMLREALDCYDAGTVEDGDLSVIGLTLEQFHHAVADRRTVLGAGGAGIAADARRARRWIGSSFSPCGRRWRGRSPRRMRGLSPRREPLTRLNRASRDRSTLSHKGRGERSRPVVNETLMKQFPNGTKPFWRFRANVLKRFTCTSLPNDAPNNGATGRRTGDDQCFIH